MTSWRRGACTIACEGARRMNDEQLRVFIVVAVFVSLVVIYVIRSMN